MSMTLPRKQVPLSLWVVVMVCCGYPCSGMLDYSHFQEYADTDMRVVLPTFERPSVRPPSFIYAPHQHWPPYNIDVQTLAPYPGCEAKYALLCTVQHAIRLVVRARNESCLALQAGSPLREAALLNITNGAFTAEDTIGFGVFVVDQNGTIIADALQRQLLGQRFDGRDASGMVAQPYLLDYLEWVVSWGGGFVPHYSRRLFGLDKNPVPASAYFEVCPSGERIGVAFGREAWPVESDCHKDYAQLCTFQIVRRLIGLNLVDWLNTDSWREIRDQNYHISYKDKYAVGAYYTLRMQINHWGYPGPDPWRNPSPFADTYETSLAHGGGLVNVMQGRNSTFLLVPGGLLHRGPVDGLAWEKWFIWVINHAAWVGGQWSQYPMYNAILGYHNKVALCVGAIWNNTAYIMLTGASHKTMPRAESPQCLVCPPKSMPCAFVNAESLAAVTNMEFLTPKGNWHNITKDRKYASRHSDATGDTIWPLGLHMFAFDYTGTCVADSENASQIGKSLVEVSGDNIAAARLERRFKAAADNGGAWVSYSWDGNSAWIAYVLKVAKSETQSQRSNFFFLGAGFPKRRAELLPNCSANFSEPCSEHNAEAIVGDAFAELVSAESKNEFVAVVGKINNLSWWESAVDITGGFLINVYDGSGDCIQGSGGCPDKLTEKEKSELAVTDKGKSKVKEFQNGERWVQAGRWVHQISRPDATYNAFVLPGLFNDFNGPSRIDISFLVVAWVKAVSTSGFCDSDGACPEHASCGDKARCACDVGYRAKFVEETSTCERRQLPSHNMSCVKVAGLHCLEASQGSNSCERCPAGFSCPNGRKVPCMKGFFCLDGAERASPCPRGTNGATTMAKRQDDCEACPRGRYSEMDGQSSCELCPQAFFSNRVGANNCTPCEVGTYSNVAGSWACKDCPRGYTTRSTHGRSASECVCPSGTYEVNSQCIQCPEGMTCSPGSSGSVKANYPKLELGYMSLEAEPFRVYKCLMPEHCGGGAPGSCQKNRDNNEVACGVCRQGAYESSNECHDCTGSSDAWPVLLFIFFLIAFLAIAVRLINQDYHKQSMSLLMATTSLGLLVSTLQSLTVFRQMSFIWFEPLRSILDFLNSFTFDIKLFRASCLVSWSPVHSFIMRQLIPPLCIPIVWIILQIKKRWHPELDILVELSNSVGTVFSAFFTSIVVSCVSPLVCYRHPGDVGSSLLSNPSILCWSDSHVALVVVGIAFVFVVPVPFTVASIYFTVNYDTYTARADAASMRRVRALRFMVFRFKPEARFYGVIMLMRSLAMCFVPIIPGVRDDAALQIGLMCGIMFIFATLQQQLRPWRSDRANVLDAVLSMCLALLLVCAALATDINSAGDAIPILGILAFALILCLILFEFVRAAISHFRPTPHYHFFMSHAKEDCSARARLMKMQLEKRTSRHVFLDSDNLRNLDGLLDIVKHSVDHLIVLLTHKTLRRPWCAAEIVMAYRANRRITAVWTESFETLKDEELDKIGSLLEGGAGMLAEYGIQADDVAAAYKRLLSNETPTVRMQVDVPMSRRFDNVVAQILGEAPKDSGTNLDDAVPITYGMLVLSSDPSDDEAAAAALILEAKLKEDFLRICDAGICCMTNRQQDLVKLKDLVAHQSRAVVILLSAHTLQSVVQLTVILEVMEHLQESSIPAMIPVSLPGFQFPDDEYYTNTLPQIWSSNTADAERRIRTFFKHIALSFDTKASDALLNIQAAHIMSLVPQSLAVAKPGQRDSQPTEPERAESEHSEHSEHSTYI